ncbi:MULTISPECIES: YggT family protein [unclassified Moraxella]|uniref:YggT family protein n=1 Tax=unclassified Moraxella TaxID=2685852 RepID=UPI003AF926C5
MTHFIAGIFDIVVGSVMLLIFMRFMMQFAGIDDKDPVGKPIYNATRLVDVFARIFPTLGNGKISVSAIVLMLLLRLIFIWGVVGMMREDSQNLGLFSMPELTMAMVDDLSRHFSPLMMLFVAMTTLIVDFLKMCQYLIIGSFVAGWVVFFTQKLPPILGLLTQLSEPLIQPFRKLLPDMGMLDLAPMIGFFAIILLEMVVQTFAVYLFTL